MADWILDGSGIYPRAEEVLLDEIRHGAVRRKARPRLAVRLLEVVVHDNQRWFGEASVRLDVLVVHGGGRSHTVEFAPSTFTFPRVADGDHLSIGDGGLLLFHGKPKWFLTMFVTASRDKPGAAPLGTLVSELITSDAAVYLEAQALAMATGIPDPQMLALALQLTLAVGETAVTFLRRETQSTIGLYRNSWLRDTDKWGVGRHPQDGLLKANDMSFAFEIVEESE
jgi:hypothetical protein